MSIDTPLPAAPVISRRTAPVTAHPLFPAVVALWFAALLGLSSLVLAPAMLERIVAASRIETVIAAAAPPLGQTARLLLALGLGGLGGLFGLILGRTLAARTRGANRVAKIDPTTDDETHDEPAPGLRDRLARLTGQGEGPRDFADLPKLRSRDRHPDAPGRKPLSAEDVAAAERMADETFVPGEPVDLVDLINLVEPELPHVALADEAEDEKAPLVLGAVLAEVPVASDETSAPALTPAPNPPAVAAILSAELDSLGIVQLTERLAISMRARRLRNLGRAEAARGGADDQAPVMLPSLVARRPEPAPEAPSAAEIGGDALASGYSSLLGLTRKPGDQFPVRAALQTADSVVRPGPFSAPAASARSGAGDVLMPSDPARDFRALKDALASLQQISGTR